MNATQLFSEDGKNILEKRREIGHHDGGNKKYIFEFCIIPNTGFLSNNDPLLKDVELKLCLDRADPQQAVMCKDADWTAIADLKFTIKDCFAVTEYVSSPDLRSYFDSIDYSPLKYNYEECEVIVKSIPQGDLTVRCDNLRGGNVPTQIFVGFIESVALNGKNSHASTRFAPHHVQYMNISLNGNSVNGYPIRTKNGIVTQPFQKFLDSTNRLCNVNAGEFLTPNGFEFNYLWSHKFEAEDNATGWIGIDFKLTQPFTESMSMVVWIISSAAIAIDKYHQIEKITY